MLGVLVGRDYHDKNSEDDNAIKQQKPTAAEANTHSSHSHKTDYRRHVYLALNLILNFGVLA